MDFGNQLAACGSSPTPYSEDRYKPPTIRQRLEAAEKSTLDRAQAIQDAKEILAKNPDIERLLDIIQKNAF